MSNGTSRNGHGNGRVKMRDYALKKPVAITADGKFILPADLEAGAPLATLSLGALDIPSQQALTLARIKADPKYDLGIVGRDRFTKDEVISEVQQLTDFGKHVISAEMAYCNEFISQRASGAVRPSKIQPHTVPMPPWGPWGPWRPHKKVKLYIKNTVVFCEAEVDAITQSAASYRIANVHPAFAARGFEVISLDGTADTRANFVAAATKPFVVYISGVGHGLPDMYTGTEGIQKPILQVGAYDPSEVKGKVVHLLSCETAQKLGPDIVAKGTKAYTGYFQDFTIVWDDPTTPANETILFWKVESTFDICMANGYTVEQAHDATIAAYNAAIASMPNTSAATWLTWDRDCFKSPMVDASYGNKDVAVPPMTAIWITVPFAASEVATAEVAVK